MLMLVLVAAAITGHALITRAYDFAEACCFLPFNYTEMTAAVISWYFFNDFRMSGHSWESPSRSVARSIFHSGNAPRAWPREPPRVRAVIG